MFHYRGNPSTDDSIPAVLQQGSRGKSAVLPRLPRYYRGYRGITAVPITVQLSSLGASQRVCNSITKKFVKMHFLLFGNNDC